MHLAPGFTNSAKGCTISPHEFEKTSDYEDKKDENPWFSRIRGASNWAALMAFVSAASNRRHHPSDSRLGSSNYRPRRLRQPSRRHRHRSRHHQHPPRHYRHSSRRHRHPSRRLRHPSRRLQQLVSTRPASVSKPTTLVSSPPNTLALNADFGASDGALLIPRTTTYAPPFSGFASYPIMQRFSRS